ncbi:MULTISPECIES: chemoreceptor glutamine deamidase CheD [unclassified Burkholderia]|uniref:chemoreceptor glutamine deamidase CheD n=1 Tax=unclassified Burkholderia TaxID=2613784 RepID=UPI000F5659FD|nr:MULTISPECIES: chemoreceptor glutamine deamidase CheD [unclassified Burkholderia]RQR73721.1 chemoreceptor glutamine deamidase CheD [Burkholderia sp. Bp9011]RQR92781.1 chemoreceptor glutamine deamidase CheD [Burkholderia sp. Bp9010]RQR98267.1 chemoreceptor glutamine deamidase CheD [Burkholderia sp. Bp8991]RQS67168.1 chemoreceptor glutamine deamidase CheD [Burkholderia sp. Bp8977]
MSALPIATNRYFDNHFERPGVKLLPNEFYTTSEDMVLMTVLGSCVAACLHDPIAGIGGMNHFMLPDDGADAGAAASESMRYGAYAMEVLMNELIKAGGRRERLEAKVFGGAAVLAGMTTINIGDRNADFVRRYLALERIRITAEDLQGVHPRKVAFMPRSGRAMVKKLRLQVPGVTEREAALAREADRVHAARTRAHVELFAAKRPAAPQPARPRIELFGARGGAGAQPANAKATSPNAGSPYAANHSRKQEA